ncbi:MAG: hypothetical protein IKZ41_11960 [Clostridia bacterium]|nr:hypothetical protein [Clostridia bacterium]MBR5367350.1 hypothetical protein [Clostridia bacterium]
MSKHVILSADNECSVYRVPDSVAASFFELCDTFHRNAKTLQIHPREWHGAVVFDETDFIEYLNEKICGDEKCVFVEKIGWEYEKEKWPEQYRKCPHYNF